MSYFYLRFLYFYIFILYSPCVAPVRFTYFLVPSSTPFPYRRFRTLWRPYTQRYTLVFLHQSPKLDVLTTTYKTRTIRIPVDGNLRTPYFLKDYYYNDQPVRMSTKILHIKEVAMPVRARDAHGHLKVILRQGPDGDTTPITNNQYQLTTEENQVTTEVNQVTTQENQVTTEENQVTTEVNQVATQENQVTTEENQQTSEIEQSTWTEVEELTPEKKQLTSEEDEQSTWTEVEEFTPQENVVTSEKNHLTSKKHQHTSEKDQKTSEQNQQKSRVACYVCGLNETGIPDTLCYDAFQESVHLKLKRDYKKYCFSGSHKVEGKKWYGKLYRDGCFKRFLDITSSYTERGCRERKPYVGASFASKRFAALEKVLYTKDEGCVFSPFAVLTPFSKSISLYTRYHVCVCQGKYCNQATKKARLKAFWLLAITANLIICF